MRESIGGAMLYWIVLFLFSIFITFLAFIIKYARVYKIKNTMINYIIRNEGVVTREGIENQLTSMSYQTNGKYKICRYFPSDTGAYFYIELHSVTQFPIIGNITAFDVTVKGETRVIDTDSENINLAKTDDPDKPVSNDWFVEQKDECYECVLGNKCTVLKNGE